MEKDKKIRVTMETIDEVERKKQETREWLANYIRRVQESMNTASKGGKQNTGR